MYNYNALNTYIILFCFCIIIMYIPLPLYLCIKFLSVENKRVYIKYKVILHASLIIVYIHDCIVPCLVM